MTTTVENRQLVLFLFIPLRCLAALLAIIAFPPLILTPSKAWASSLVVMNEVKKSFMGGETRVQPGSPQQTEKTSECLGLCEVKRGDEQKS